MRIVLLYPPPWKIPAPGEPADDRGDGPPTGFRETDVDADFFQMPYGLLSLAAQALRAGHQVKVLNLAWYPWSQVKEVIGRLRADLYGLSCFTANRRGVALVASCIREHHPQAHVVVGGAHATALPIELLEHYPAIDTVVLGEGEATFLELVERLESGQPTRGIEGTAYRADGRAQLGPPRARIAQLDSLASPHDYFDTHLFMTSRGCPGRCTFCAKNVVWGSKYRTHSVGYVLDTLAGALARLPLKMLLVKDDTFTTDRTRALEICNGIIDRGLSFIWSCDTRADVLDAELVRALRLAGCQRLSLGVESGSPAILHNIRKNVLPDAILEATELAKAVGLQVRYFMMLGNRGETAETFQQSLAFVQRAQPHQSIFACLSIYPGTPDFEELERAGVLSRELFFTENFQELKLPFDASAADTELMSEWFYAHLGVQDHHRPDVAEYEAILRRLGDYHAAHLDLGAALCAAERLEPAERHLRRALELGYPVPELVHNTLACVAARRGDFSRMDSELSQAMRGAPHRVLVQNLRAVSTWRAQRGRKPDRAPELVFCHDFELPEPRVQPMLPGPLPPRFADWS
jgi:anaerobic magnesium-protoporphyrin IX monomethyl ester cyclase